MSCEHLDFSAQVDVFRRTDTGKPDAKVVGFSADVKIACSHCGIPFHFLGVDPGVSVNRPMVSPDATELRVAIDPGPRELRKDLVAEFVRKGPEIPPDWADQNNPAAFHRCIDWDRMIKELEEWTPEQRTARFHEYLEVLGSILLRLLYYTSFGKGEFSAKTFKNPVTGKDGIVVVSIGRTMAAFDEIAANLQEAGDEPDDGMLDITELEM